VLPVALAGWWDDHRSLPILPRLGAQVLGAGLFSLSLLATGTRWWWLPLLIAGGVWSINLHNFMDGIDGLLAQQVIFVGAGLAMLAWAAAQPVLALAAACMAVSAGVLVLQPAAGTHFHGRRGQRQRWPVDFRVQ